MKRICDWESFRCHCLCNLYERRT